MKRRRYAMNRATRIAAQIVAAANSPNPVPTPAPPANNQSAQPSPQAIAAEQKLVQQRANEIRRVLNPSNNNVLSHTGGNHANNLEWFEKDRKITMANLEQITTRDRLRIPVLFDTGALPLSYISKRWMEQHNLMH